MIHKSIWLLENQNLESFLAGWKVETHIIRQFYVPCLQLLREKFHGFIFLEHIAFLIGLT
jgi:hypothetical protein